MSGAADWRAAATLPPPRFDAAPLAHVAALTGDPAGMIRRGELALPAPDWRAGQSALETLFALDLPSHCFRAAPHDWATFHEPQITRGLVHFLSAGGKAQRLARATAFAKAAMACARRDTAIVDAFAPHEAECVAEEGRTDILVELQGGGRRMGVAIEAKFGHILTAGQLPKTQRHALDVRRWDADRSLFLILAAHAADLDGKIWDRNATSWGRASWWGFLTCLERHTDPAHDCDDYRRFRRTVWHRAY